MDCWNDGWMTEEESDEYVARYRAKVKHDVEAFDAMLKRKSENDWRDEGTEANKRVERLLARRSAWQKASIVALVASIVLLIAFAASYGNPTMGFIWFGVHMLGFSFNMIDEGYGVEIKAITEAS